MYDIDEMPIIYSEMSLKWKDSYNSTNVDIFSNFFRTMWISTWVVCQSLTIDLAHCSAKSFESNLNVSETRIVFGLKTQNTSEYESRVQYMQYSSSILGLIGKMVHQISCVCTIIYLQKLKKTFCIFYSKLFNLYTYSTFFPGFFSLYKYITDHTSNV